MHCLDLGRGTEDSYLDAVIAVGEVVHWFVLLVNNTNAGLMGADGDSFDVSGCFPTRLQFRVNVFCRLDGGLRVEFRCSECQPICRRQDSDRFTWIGDLEENILHHVAAVWTLEPKFLAFEQHIIETPYRGRQNCRDSLLSFLNL